VADRSSWRRNQPGFWATPLTRAQMDQRKPEVGDRVSCAGRPYVIEYINADGSLGIAYDGRASSAPTKNPPR